LKSAIRQKLKMDWIYWLNTQRAKNVKDAGITMRVRAAMKNIPTLVPDVLTFWKNFTLIWKL
jgi:hypothetical protein